MEVNELRIGNFVSIDNEIHHPKLKDVPMIVCSISRTYHKKYYYYCDLDKVNRSMYYFQDFSQMIEYLKPIPLTEEWFLRFGFSKKGFKKGRIGIEVSGEDMTTTYFAISQPKKMVEWQNFWAFEYNDYRFVKLEYVHQLQNLYFALTGKELTLKPETNGTTDQTI